MLEVSWLQGTQDLEEVLSERLQQLPQPLSCLGSMDSSPNERQQQEDIFGLDDSRRDLRDQGLSRQASKEPGDRQPPLVCAFRLLPIEELVVQQLQRQGMWLLKAHFDLHTPASWSQHLTALLLLKTDLAGTLSILNKFPRQSMAIISSGSGS